MYDKNKWLGVAYNPTGCWLFDYKRFGEKLAQMIMPKISFLMPSKYKPISAEKVARAMVQISKMDFKGVKIFHYKEINRLSDRLQSGNY